MVTQLGKAQLCNIPLTTFCRDAPQPFCESSVILTCVFASVHCVLSLSLFLPFIYFCLCNVSYFLFALAIALRRTSYKLEQQQQQWLNCNAHKEFAWKACSSKFYEIEFVRMKDAPVTYLPTGITLLVCPNWGTTAKTFRTGIRFNMAGPSERAREGAGVAVFRFQQQVNALTTLVVNCSWPVSVVKTVKRLLEVFPYLC